MRKCMWINHRALKIINILITSSSWKRLCKGWSKLQGSGMKGLATSFSHMAMKGEWLTRLSSSKSQILKLSLCKSMLMTSSLVLHKIVYVKNLWLLWKVSLKCLWWENCLSFLDCRLNKQRMESFYANQSIVKRFSINLKWRVARKQAHLYLQATTWMQMLLEKG